MKDNGNMDGIRLSAEETLTTEGVLELVNVLRGARRHRSAYALLETEVAFLLALIRESRGAWDDAYCPPCNLPKLPETPNEEPPQTQYCEGRH